MFGWIKRIIMWFIQTVIMPHTLFYVPNKNKVALSIDDSPRNSTNEILDILDEYNVKATFFIIGENANERPNTVREILRRGHEIGNHTIVDEASFRNTPEEFRNHVLRTKEIIDNFTEEPTKLFRPGSGITLNWMYPILEELGYKITIENKDYYAISTSSHAFDVNVPRSWVNGFCSWFINDTTKGGDIIDIHDRNFTTTELRKVIEHLQNKGCEICKISDIIN